MKKLLEGIEKTVWAIDKDREYEIAKSLSTVAKGVKNIEEHLKYISYDAKIKYDKEKKKREKKFIKSLKERQMIN